MNGNGDSRLLSRGDLHRRGWTAAVISKFLSDADETQQNPHNWRLEMKLYWAPRVKLLEMKPEVQEAMQAAAKRKVAAGKALLTRRCRLIEAVTEKPAPDLSHFTKAQIMRATLERIAVDHLEDLLDDYRGELVAGCRRAGIADRDRAVNVKILDVIATAQPWLSGECTRRKKRFTTQG